MSPRRITVLTMSLCGMLAGLAGVLEILGRVHHYPAIFGTSLGFEGSRSRCSAGPTLWESCWRLYCSGRCGPDPPMQESRRHSPRGWARPSSATVIPSKPRLVPKIARVMVDPAQDLRGTRRAGRACGTATSSGSVILRGLMPAYRAAGMGSRRRFGPQTPNRRPPQEPPRQRNDAGRAPRGVSQRASAGKAALPTSPRSWANDGPWTRRMCVHEGRRMMATAVRVGRGRSTTTS